jgi:signal transduction histidine kinase
MRRHGWDLAAGAGVGAALLVLLGALQVRWLDHVAQTIAAQKRAALLRQGTAVATDLQRELTRAFFWFELEPGAEPSVLVERWRSWQQAGRHPSLVAAVWLAEASAGEEARLRRLGPSGALEEQPWPAALRELREVLRDEVRIVGLMPITDEDRAWLALSNGGRETVLLELDGRYLTRDLLPALAEEHRGRGDESGPVLIRLEHGDGRPLFSTSAVVSVRAGEHDPIDLPGIRPDLITPELLAGMRPPRTAPLEPPGRFRARTGDPLPGGIAGPGFVFNLGPGPGMPPPRRVFGRGPRGGAAPLLTRAHLPGFSGHPPGLGPWRLSLAFAAGPVDAVVTSLRRRNMTLAFSILALLGGAIAALTVAVRRAHALAERQRQFSASISHELRTPLAVIGAAAENLRDGTVEDASRVREYGSIIHAESKRLGALLDQTLRLAAGRALGDELRLQPVALRAVVDAAVTAFAGEAQARGALVERRYPVEELTVAADPEVLRQAVENVLGNALKYGGPSPRVEVRLSRVATPAGPAAQIAVEDRGLGIPTGEVEQVFEPFFRGREALDRQIGGTGLGLALVWQVMKAHGGSVSVASTPGQGSVFSLRLPCAAAEAGPG